ncbi:maltokinase N-terminal cap-like domain-containing protein [Glutamicibacter sp.]|uniref:maltokinase N-terminal cap-like domain-containing protein n=1 Tax=Glutamicibacter sp. TaxID=1931995 RepID=UPI0028BDFF3D|nr:hypothetical protein [Glutamicibacter sp.]
MGIIYNTSMKPGKDELVSAWLIKQAFFTSKREPNLQHVGGFRLEDPAGKVGIEFRFYADNTDLTDVIYHVPLTYRDAPLPGAQKYLMGTSEHGILGTRYIYDAVGDPVFNQQLAALAAGTVNAQHRHESFTEEPRVRRKGNLTGKKLDVVRKPVVGARGSEGVIGFWENALGQELRGLVLRTA